MATATQPMLPAIPCGHSICSPKNTARFTITPTTAGAVIGTTIAAACSVRGMPHGPVSAPVTWAELPDVEMDDFTIATVPARFADLGDLHAGIDDAVFDIDQLVEWAERDERDGAQDPPETADAD